MSTFHIPSRRGWWRWALVGLILWSVASTPLTLHRLVQVDKGAVAVYQVNGDEPDPGEDPPINY